MKIKYCTKCLETNSIDEFYRFKYSKDGKTCYCKECIKKIRKKWREDNPEKHLNRCKIWFEKNRSKKNEINKRYYYTKGKLREKSHSERLSHAISSLVYYSLKNSKNGCHWEELLGYKLEDLMKHLAARFKDGMTLENYGEWHVDHVIPRSKFYFSNHKDEGFQKCWGLQNLQPLWKEENLIKGDRLS